MSYASRYRYGIEDLLDLLRRGRGRKISESEICAVLGVNRDEISRRIAELRSLGYAIESSGSGYEMTGTTRLLVPWEICRSLKTRILGRSIVYFESIESTQGYALDAAADLEDGAVITARRQTGGRGRMKKRWISPDGGIWLSVILRPRMECFAVTLSPIAASVALADAIYHTLGVRVDLKWPNDLIVNGAKVGGILTDLSMERGRACRMVIGVGLNYSVRTEDLLEVRNGTGGHGAATLAEWSRNKSPVPLVGLFLENLESAFASLEDGGGAEMLERWTRRSITLGRDVTVTNPDGTIRGRAVGIDSDGALLVMSGGVSHRVIAGDVT